MGEIDNRELNIISTQIKALLKEIDSMTDAIRNGKVDCASTDDMPKVVGLLLEVIALFERYDNNYNVYNLFFENEIGNTKDFKSILAFLGNTLFLGIADRHFKDKNMEDALKYYQIAFSAGSIEAGLRLAKIYQEYYHEFELELKYLKELIMLGEYQQVTSNHDKQMLAIAYVRLGDINYNFKCGDDKFNYLSNITSFDYYKKASELEYGLGYLRLADMYLLGCGCDKNDEEAIRYYQLAKDAGEERAQYYLDMLTKEKK